MITKQNIHSASFLLGRVAVILLIVAATGCNSEEFDHFPADSALQQTGLPDGAIEISPLDQTLDMAVWGSDSTKTLAPVSSVSVTSPEADFVMPIGTQHLYVEQNDDRQWRTATVSVTRADGTQQQLTLAQPPATRATEQEIHRSFLRHHAVGYSYDAVGGEYCNMNYVRCQLLNRMVLDEVEKTSMVKLVNVDYLNRSEYSHTVFRSLVDYAQNSNFEASVSGQILFAFSGDMDTRLHAFEDGAIETYILRDERKLPKVRYTLNSPGIAFQIEKHPNLLTSSFRKALKQLAATSVDNWRAIDEFLEVYGSHVVVDAELGARLDLDIQVETHKFHETINEDLLANVAIATLFKAHFEEHREDAYWEVLRNCKCKFDVTGGDTRILDDLIGMTTFASDGINISEATLDEWLSSVYFNDNDLENSNVELTKMRVVPIWNLVSDRTLKDRIRARVYNNAAIMQKLLGNRNFINVKIPYSTTEYVCRVGNMKYKFPNPDVTDIIYAGRHVATICLEPVPDITEKEKVRVVYPIYEGHVKLSKGLCVYNGHSYSVDWSNNKLQVNDLGALDDAYDGNIYMNFGNLSTTKMPYAEYREGHPIIGIERPGSIGIDGSLQGTPVRVVKYFNHFYLNDKKQYDNVPNWSYATELPEEAPYFPQYFKDDTWKNRMRRDNSYVYFYNSTEIGYE